MIRTLLASILLAASTLLLGSCAAFHLAGAMAQNYEYQKLIQVLPQYSGLEDQSIAVVVDADMATLYEHPDLVANIVGGVSGRIQENVPGARVIDPRVVLGWQYRTPQWNAMPYGQLTEELNVDRVVYIDIHEYRLNPPGNRWEWEGVCAANVGIIERGSFMPDSFADSFNVTARFPTMTGVSRSDAQESQVAFGLLSEFIKRAAWLFYEHEEPKYPDKYVPPEES